MAASGAVRISGLQQVNRAFKRIDSQLVDGVKRELVKIGEPIAASARGTIARYPGAVTSTITPIATMRGVVIRQRQRKRGNRGDFGAIQMRHLLAARASHASEINDQVEDFIDYLGRKEGF